MNYREVEILGPTDLGTAGTKIIDIDMADVISTIYLVWRTKVVTVSDMLAPHVACLSKIEIVDGSDVLFSLSGEEAQALAFYTQGQMPLNNITVVVDDYMESVIPIYFGRYRFDPLLALDPKKFRNTQLKITWDEDAANTSVVVNELTVRSWVFDQKTPTPKGFLMSKEIKTYTPAANAYEYTDLPTDYPYRLLLFRSKSTDTEPLSVLAQLKLSEEHDKRIPLDMSGDEIFSTILQPMGQIHQKVRLNETAADAMALYLAPTFLHSGQMDMDADVIAADDDWTQLAYANNKVTIAATVNFVPYLLSLSGYCPHSCLAVPLGLLSDPDTWYNTPKLDHLRLTTLGGAAVGTSPSATIAIQQVRS